MLNESDYNEEKSTSQASSLILLSPFPWIFPLVSLDSRYRGRHVANLVSHSFKLLLVVQTHLSLSQR